MKHNTIETPVLTGNLQDNLGKPTTGCQTIPDLAEQQMTVLVVTIRTLETYKTPVRSLPPALGCPPPQKKNKVLKFLLTSPKFSFD